jgi:hypothetical protein
MKIIISESQLKNIVSEQLSDPDDFSIKSVVNNVNQELMRRNSENEPMNAGQGIFQKGKAWWSNTPISNWLNVSGDSSHPLDDIIYKTVGDLDWNFDKDGNFYTTKAGEHSIIKKGKWGYDKDKNIVINYNNSVYNSGTDKWTPITNNIKPDPKVIELQKQIKSTLPNFDLGGTGPNKDGIDGIMGPKTRQGIKLLQQGSGTTSGSGYGKNITYQMAQNGKNLFNTFKNIDSSNQLISQAKANADKLKSGQSLSNNIQNPNDEDLIKNPSVNNPY